MKKRLIVLALFLGLFMIVGYLYYFSVDGTFYTLQEPVNDLGYDLVRVISTGSVDSMLIKDINSNGSLELVYKTGGNRNSMHIHILNGDNVLLAKCAAGGSGNGNEIMIIEDLDSDGMSEIIVAGSLWDNDTFWWGDYELRVFDSDCNLMNSYFLSGYLGETKQLVVSNIDDDIEKEIFIETRNGVFKVDGDTISKSSNTDINFALDEAKTMVDDWKPIYSRRLTIGSKTYKLWGSALSVDVDGDSINEVIVISSEPISTRVGYTMIFVFNSEGGLIWNYRFPTWISEITVEDMDGDDMKEIVVGGHSGNIFILGSGPSFMN